jgi:predicted ATPase/DNA-binding SARP family transcriptional activator
VALELRILGPLEVLRDGEPLRVVGRVRRSILALLALHLGEVVSTDRLIEELWNGYDEGARGRLQVTISHLRTALGPEAAALETRPGGYALAVEPDAVDALRFERLAALGRESLGAEEAERAAETLAKALALWRGPPLGDLAYEGFAQAATARLEELRLAALEDRIDAELQLGRHVDLVAELEQLVAEQPLRERLRGQLMLALYRSGRQADALAAYRETRRILDEELGLEPGDELNELQHAILRQDAALRVEAPELRARRHLPAPATPLVGRDDELGELSGLLRRDGVRLVTLTGPGGTGKTRLALQVAHDLADVFADGVFFVDLSSLRGESLVPGEVARALGLEEQPEEPVTKTLEIFLRDRRALLLVDNFEVVDAAAPLLAELLAAAPRLALLVTSRTPLRLSAEHEFRVPPLSPSAAARLFAVRARAVAPGFRRPSEEASEVEEVCRLVDYLPLGIELAAARTRELAPSELLAQMQRPLELAGDGPRDLPARHRTLRATIDWSYELLAADERELFARLAVFAGGCALGSAEAVCPTSRAVLAALVGSSLVRERVGPDGAPRYAMLETVRDYALERFEASGDADALRRRHAEHYAAEAERAEGELSGDQAGRWLARLQADQANFRTALDWCRASGDVQLQLRLAGALARFWVIRSYLREGRAWLEGALQADPTDFAELRAKALAGATTLAFHQGDRPAMSAFAEEHLALARTLGDKAGVAQALDRLATVASNDGDFERARALYEESIAIARDLGDLHRLAVSTNNLGCLALMQGDYEQARTLCSEGLALFSELGEHDEMPPPIFNVGLAALFQGRHAEALDRFRAGLELTRGLESYGQSMYLLEGLAAVLAATGREEEAARLLGAAGTVGEATGASLEPFELEVHERTVAAIEAGLGDDAFAAAFAEGRSFELRQAVDYGLEASSGREVESRP